MKRMYLTMVFLCCLTFYYQCAPTPPAGENGTKTEDTSDKNSEPKVDTKDASTDGATKDETSESTPDGTTKETPGNETTQDDTTTCKVGETQPCYGGPKGTAGTGECKAGEQTCQSNGEWGKCIGEVLPASDDNCDGRDDNCDGQVDEAFSAGGKDCDVNGQAGICKKGTSLCKAGQLECQQVNTAKAETCDGTDEDCNGTIDDIAALGKVCKVPGEKGSCEEGKWTCTGGQKTCEATTQPTTEACNGKDDDCDGMIDNNITEVGKACTVSGAKGPCAKSTMSCELGQIECKQSTAPSPELCNGKDDDCDGMIDNNTTDTNKACTVSGQQGACAASKTTCQAGKVECPQTVQPSTEVCNTKDDDCDGKTDSGCPSGVTLPVTNTRTAFVGDNNPNNGTSAHLDRCPAGEAIVGATITAASGSGFIRSILFTCAKILMSPQHQRTPPEFLIVRDQSSATPLTLRGTRNSGYTGRISCPLGTFLYGFSGRKGTLIDALTGHCTTLVAGNSSPYSITRDMLRTSQSTGSMGGGPFGLTACPANMIATGAFTRTSHSLFGLSLACSRPTMALHP